MSDQPFASDAASYSAGRAPAGPAPRTVDAAFWLYIAGAALGVVGLIVTLALLPGAITTAQQELRQTSAQNVPEGVVVGIAVGAAVLSAVLSLAYAVLMVVFALKMRRGANWARITLAVLAGVQIFGVLGPFGIGAVHFLVVLAALILTFVPASNAWFAQVRATRTPAI